MNPIASWISAAKRGETEGVGLALESFRGYLLAVARGSMEPDLAAKGGASDLVQDTFLEAHKDLNASREAMRTISVFGCAEF